MEVLQIRTQINRAHLPVFQQDRALHDHVVVLRANDPTRLVVADEPLLAGAGTRFFLSCGTTRDRATARDTRAFSRELRSLGLPHELWLAPGGHDGSLWRRQLPAALLFALRR